METDWKPCSSFQKPPRVIAALAFVERRSWVVCAQVSPPLQDALLPSTHKMAAHLQTKMPPMKKNPGYSPGKGVCVCTSGEAEADGKLCWCSHVPFKAWLREERCCRFKGRDQKVITAAVDERQKGTFNCLENNCSLLNELLPTSDLHGVTS